MLTPSARCLLRPSGHTYGVHQGFRFYVAVFFLGNLGYFPQSQGDTWVAGLGVLEKGSLGCGLSKPIMGFQSPSWAFVSRKMALIFLEALSLWVRCRRRFFFSTKKGPIFLEALDLWVRCRRRLFFRQKRAPYFWKPLTCGYVAAGASFFRQKRAPYFLARIHQIWARIMRARHGNIWHGTGS